MKTTEKLYKQIWRLIKLGFKEGFNETARVDVLLEKNYLGETFKAAEQISKVRRREFWRQPNIEISAALTEVKPLTVKTVDEMTDTEINSNIDVVAAHDDYKLQLSPTRIREIMKLTRTKMEPYEEGQRSVIRLSREQVREILSNVISTDEMSEVSKAQVEVYDWAIKKFPKKEVKNER